ncbi:hypothetical protein AMATHDRAFT_68947 [Amanita thiersii Skay4041]|uniref:Uncharacterized protein n=1 Tax=Amanita thiersii Skay4041 TaxID=703135 RepID=A0A2A9N9V2_9AGAR|nr:hypothetical protein AMATHDRAFT_68947 [Amanita thiersii Skay4041]
MERVGCSGSWMAGCHDLLRVNPLKFLSNGNERCGQLSAIIDPCQLMSLQKPFILPLPMIYRTEA